MLAQLYLKPLHSHISPQNFTSNLVWRYPTYRGGAVFRTAFWFVAIRIRLSTSTDPRLLPPTQNISPSILPMFRVNLHRVLLSPPILKCQPHSRSHSQHNCNQFSHPKGNNSHRPPSMIISQPRNPTLRLDPAQLRTIRPRNPCFLHPLLRLGNICFWSLGGERIPVTGILRGRCHLLFQAGEAGPHRAWGDFVLVLEKGQRGDCVW
jgi:hypothetical protein